jgi:hypothetical protein
MRICAVPSLTSHSPVASCAQAGTAVMKAVMKEAAINAGNLQRTASPLYRRQQSAEIAAILSRDGPTSLGHCSKNEPAAL